MGFINWTDTIGVVIDGMTTNITGSLSATIMMIILLLIAICLAFRVPLEVTIPIVLPMIISAMAKSTDYLTFGGIAIIYLSIVVVKRIFL